MNNRLRGCSMQQTEKFIKEFIAEGGAGDVAVVIGDREGEAYRFFHSNRGDVLNGKTLCDMMSVFKAFATFAGVCLPTFSPSMFLVIDNFLPLLTDSINC